jgi:hypothetical protein
MVELAVSMIAELPEILAPIRTPVYRMPITELDQPCPRKSP